MLFNLGNPIKKASLHIPMLELNWFTIQLCCTWLNGKKWRSFLLNNLIVRFFMCTFAKP